MTTSDDPYPREWLNEPPREDDPRFGTCLDVWQPTAGQRALVGDLLLMYLARSKSFTPAFLNFCTDAYREKTLPQAFLALFELFATTATSGQAEALAVRRLAEDLRMARGDALEEAGS